MILTDAVSTENEVGCVAKATSIAVELRYVTVPDVAPRLNVTVGSTFCEKPVPKMTIDAAIWESDAVDGVTVGTTVATAVDGVVYLYTATVAVRVPRSVGWADICTVSCVVVAAVTVPAAPRLNVTTFWAGTGEKLDPVMMTWVVAPHTYTFCGVAVMAASSTTVPTRAGTPGGATADPAASMPALVDAPRRCSLARRVPFLGGSAASAAARDAFLDGRAGSVKFFFLKKEAGSGTSGVAESRAGTN